MDGIEPTPQKGNQAVSRELPCKELSLQKIALLLQGNQYIFYQTPFHCTDIKAGQCFWQSRTSDFC